MKAVILAGGKGTRFNKFNKSMNKCLFPILNKRLIEYSIDNCIKLKNNKLLDSIIVVLGFNGKTLKEFIMNKYDENNIEFVYQKIPSAVGAILSANKLITENESFLLMLGDEILINNRLDSMINFYNEFKMDGVIGYCNVKNIDNIKKTYSIGFDKIIYELIEKPKDVKNTMMGTGNCILPYDYFKWCKNINLESVVDFVSVVQYGIKKYYKFMPFDVCDYYFNINNIDDISDYNDFIMETLNIHNNIKNGEMIYAKRK